MSPPLAGAYSSRRDESSLGCNASVAPRHETLGEDNIKHSVKNIVSGVSTYLFFNIYDSTLPERYSLQIWFDCILHIELSND